MHFFVDESKIDFEVGLHILIDFFLLSPFSPFPLPEMILKKKKKKEFNPCDISPSVLVLLSSRDDFAIVIHASKTESVTNLSLRLLRWNLPLLSKCSLLQCKQLRRYCEKCLVKQ